MNTDSDTRRRDHILYRWWDENGELLYVGKSVALFNRIQSHRRNSAFFAEAAAMTIQRLPNAEDLASAEIAAIASENPRYNIASGRHDPDKPSTRILITGPASFDVTEPARWVPIEYEEIAIGDLIRCSHPGVERLGFQGYVDDEYLEDDGEGWYILLPDGEEGIFDAETAREAEIYKWDSPTPNDQVSASSLDSWYREFFDIQEGSDAR